MAVIRGLPWHGATWAALQPLRVRAVHAVLLHGPAGIGKKSLALDFAAGMLCEAPAADGRACGNCTGCVLVNAGSHPDLRVVVPDMLAEWRGPPPEVDEDALDEPDEPPAGEAEPAKGKKISREILIQQVRALADFLSTSTHRGGARVVVLAPAETLNAASANALLKMLEEPPPASFFILASDALDDVLPTIRSRCVLVRCALPDVATAAGWLRAQQVEAPDQALAEAGGAPLLALPVEEGDPSRLDPEQRALLLELLARGAALAPAEIAARVPKALPVGAALALMQRGGWDLLALSALRAPQRVRYHPQAAATLQRIAAGAPIPAWVGWLRSLTRRRASQDHPLNARLVIEAALLDYVACLRETGSAT
jgi:DNA polymerase III subunit delta'